MSKISILGLWVFGCLAPLHAQRVEASYSAVAESVMRTMSGGKALPRGLGAVYVTACASGAAYRVSDAELLRSSPVAVQPGKLSIATISASRYRANRPLRWGRNFATLGFLAATVWASGNSGGALARGLQKGSGIATPVLGILDNEVNKLEKDPDYTELLNPQGPRYILEPGQCREGFFFVRFDRGFVKQSVIVPAERLQQASFELIPAPPGTLTGERK